MRPVDDAHPVQPSLCSPKPLGFVSLSFCLGLLLLHAAGTDSLLGIHMPRVWRQCCRGRWHGMHRGIGEAAAVHASMAILFSVIVSGRARWLWRTGWRSACSVHTRLLTGVLDPLFGHVAACTHGHDLLYWLSPLWRGKMVLDVGQSQCLRRAWAWARFRCVHSAGAQVGYGGRRLGLCDFTKVASGRMWFLQC